MTFRVAFPALVVAAALALAFGEGSAKAAAPSGGLSNPATTWGGQFYGVPVIDPTLCLPASLDLLNATCDHFSLDVPAAGTEQVGISWSSADNDFDLYVYDSSGNLVAASDGGWGTSEIVTFAPAAAGRYEIRVVPFFVVASDYSGSAKWSSTKSSTKPLEQRLRIDGGGHVAPMAGNLLALNDQAQIEVSVRQRLNDPGTTTGKIRYQEPGFSVRSITFTATADGTGFSGFGTAVCKTPDGVINNADFTFDAHDTDRSGQSGGSSTQSGPRDHYSIECFEAGILNDGPLLTGDFRFRVQQS